MKATNPKGPCNGSERAGSERVMRGDAWLNENYAGGFTSVVRYRESPAYKYNGYHSFRIACSGRKG